MYLKVVGVITQSGLDITMICNEAAGRYGLPPRVLAACGIAESNLNEDAVRERTWPDYSYGVWQQAAKWAPIGDQTASSANLALVRERFTTDLPFAADVAARQLGHYWGLYTDGIETCCRYNRPNTPGHENANWPNCARAWTASERYVAAQEAPTVYTPTVHHDRGTVAGFYGGTPQGVILHGSRSGIAGRPVQVEYDGTRRYAASGIELGWSCTVGEDTISIHMSPREWGWNARAASRRFLAVELAQATVQDAITDGQVRALCWWIRQEVLPVWPDLDVTSLPMHSELPEGQADGKSDCFPRGDARGDALRQRIAAELAAQQGGGTLPGEDDLSAEERTELADLRNLVGNINGGAETPGWIDSAISAITEAKRERLKTPRNALLDAALAASATIKRGGPEEE